MNKLSRKDLLLVSLMLFSLFFGAGNLIFPPFLGQSAGTEMWVSMLGFFNFNSSYKGCLMTQPVIAYIF